MNMKSKLKIFVAVITICLPVAAFAEVIDGIAAIVNDEPITTYEVEKEQSDLEKMLEKNPSAIDPDKARLHETALDSIINKKLVAHKIKELDIKVSDEEVKQAIEDVKRQNNISQEALLAALNGQGISFEAYKAQLKEQLERLRLVSQEVRSKIQISDKEVREFYAAHPEKFETEGTFHALLITLSVPDNATKEEKTRIADKASGIQSEAKSGKDFGELAKKYSDDASAKEGGDMGAFKQGEMVPEFEAVLTKLSPGEVSGPFATQSGIHIVKLVERSRGKSEPYEKVKGQIEDMLYKKKSEERFNQWLADLRKSAAIEIRH
jgi:peptidyl-prolyl cis-trans isomerase SurA